MRTIMVLSLVLSLCVYLEGQTIDVVDNNLKSTLNTISGEISIPRAFYSNTNLTAASLGNKIQKRLGMYLGNLKIKNAKATVSATSPYKFKYSIKGIVPLFKPIEVKIHSIYHHPGYEAYFVLSPDKSVTFLKKGTEHKGCDFKVKIDLKQVE